MKEERNYTVYIHVNKINSKTYVGITMQNPPEKRWANGMGYIHNKYFTRAIEKYNWNIGFEHIILFKDKTKKEAEELEILFIKILKSNNPKYGYNISNGGNTVGTHSEETKLKISRIKKGKNLSYKNYISKKVICDNKEFGCIIDCANYYNINNTTMGGWLNKNVNMPQKFIDLGLRYVNDDNTYYEPQKIRKIICNNKIFNTIEECAEYYNIKPQNLYNWLTERYGMPEKYIKLGLRYVDDKTTIYNKQTTPTSTKIICDDIIFDTIESCANYYNISRGKITYWLRLNKMPQQFIDMKLRYYNKINFDNNQIPEIMPLKRCTTNKEVVCDNMIFYSIRNCADYYKINHNTMACWLSGRSKMPIKFIKLGLAFSNDENNIKQARYILCGNKIFDTMSDCADYYNIPVSRMQSWFQLNSMPQNFIDLGLRWSDDDNFNPNPQIKPSKLIICDNKVFNKTKNCANYYDIQPQNVSRWLNGARKMPQKYIDLGLRYYNPEVDGDIEQYEQYIETKAV